MARPAISGTPEQWRALADWMKRRRDELKIRTHDEAVDRVKGQITRSVWSIAERHAQAKGTMAPSSLAAICEALEWTPDSITQRIFLGDPPLPIESQAGVIVDPAVARLITDDSFYRVETERTLTDHEDRLRRLELALGIVGDTDSSSAAPDATVHELRPVPFAADSPGQQPVRPPIPSDITRLHPPVPGGGQNPEDYPDDPAPEEP